MTALDRIPAADAGLTPYRFTWADVVEMGRAGLFGDATVELIGGEIFVMPDEGFLHVDSVHALQRWLLASVAVLNLEISIRAPVHLPDGSVVVPDLSVFPAGTDARGMMAARALLIIEVADSTEARDRTLKLPRYAAAGVPEVWLVQAQARAVQVHRAPLDGEWTLLDRFLPGRPVAPIAAPDAAFDPELLPKS
jgi:Uma2 family endonuclease